MRTNWIITIIVGILIGASSGYCGDDFQYWSQYSVKVIDTQKVDFTLFGEGRIYNNSEDLGLYYLSGRVTYDFVKHLQLGTNYTYLNYKSRPSSGDLGDWRFQHRAELEVNPYFDLGTWLKIKVRNRMEFRWIENNGSYNTRFRHRWTLTHPLKDMGVLKDVYTSSEFIYNLAEHTYDENRTVPIGATFKVNDKVSMQAFYMIQSKKGTDDWASNQILGTLISLKF